MISSAVCVWHNGCAKSMSSLAAVYISTMPPHNSLHTYSSSRMPWHLLRPLHFRMAVNASKWEALE